MYDYNGYSRPCPSCGHCPTCGRGGHHCYPYNYWYGGIPSTGVVTTTNADYERQLNLFKNAMQGATQEKRGPGRD